MKKTVFVKELSQFAEVISTAETGEVKEVKVKTPFGEKVIDILEKGYTIVSTLKAVIEIIVNLIKSFKK